jgi:hypothetical protein
MDADDSQTADPVDIPTWSQAENAEAVEGNEAAVVDLEHAAFDNDLAVDTAVKQDSDDFPCNETATETVKAAPVGDANVVVPDDKPGAVPDDDFGDISTAGVTQEQTDSDKMSVSNNDTPFEEAKSSDSNQDSSPDDDARYFSAVDAISTGFNDFSIAEDDEEPNNGETADTTEGDAAESETHPPEDDNGDFSVTDVNAHSAESGNNEDSEGASEPLQDDAFSSFSTESIGDGKNLLLDATEKDESAVLPKKGTESGVILDDSEQPSFKDTDHTIEDEMQAHASQTTSEALPADVVDRHDADSGDFGTFNEATTSSESQSVVTPLTGVDQQAADLDADDDDFGDFGSFEQAEDITQSSQMAEQVEKPEQAAVSEEAGQNDDDDDDFGDFGDFTDFVDQASQDVGEQGAGDDNSPVTRSVGDVSSGPESHSFAQANTTGIVDPVIQKAESVFQGVFGSAVEGCDSVEADCDAPPRAIVSIESVLVSTTLSVRH